MSDDNSGDEKPYKVGYGRPPLGTRWTSAHQPENRRSRKGIRNLKTEVSEFMDEKVWVTGQDGKRRRMTRRMSLLRQVYGRGHNKESGTALRLLELDMKLSQPTEPAQSRAEVGADDDAIMADFFRRAIEEVKASEATETAPATPKADADDTAGETEDGDA